METRHSKQMLPVFSWRNYQINRAENHGVQLILFLMSDNGGTEMRQNECSMPLDMDKKFLAQEIYGIRLSAHNL